MTKAQVFEGEITENGRAIASGLVEVFVTDSSISIKKHVKNMFRSKSLIIHGFSRQVFLGATVEDGCQISLEEKNLGIFKNGPLVHPLW